MWIWMVLCFFIGTVFGFIFAALLSVNHDKE